MPYCHPLYALSWVLALLVKYIHGHLKHNGYTIYLTIKLRVQTSSTLNSHGTTTVEAALLPPHPRGQGSSLLSGLAGKFPL